jgi:glycosyltransferase involved in cell wall biosynthesis
MKTMCEAIFTNQSPLVSVILPVRNMELFIKQAIDSILNQVFVDFELIIIDDASTDNTAQILTLYTDKRIIHLQNDIHMGNYPCRNKGINIAKGKYLAMMDGDDIAFPDRLKKQYDYLEKHTDIVAVGSTFIFSTGERKVIPLPYEEIMLALLDNNCMLHSSLMLRSSIMQTLNGYNEEFIYSSDYDLICRLVLKGKIENMPDVLMMYRIHSLQISQFHYIEQQAYADRIRKDYILRMANRYKGENHSAPHMPEISFGAMGHIIFYYLYACYTSNQQYEQLADELLEKVFQNVHAGMPARLNEGLCGLGCGMMYVLRNKFANGVEDEILEEIDHAVFSSIFFRKENEETDWYGQLYYLRQRIFSDVNNRKQLNHLRNQQTLIYFLDSFERYIIHNNYHDKEIILELNRIYETGFCKQKVSNILNKLKGIPQHKNEKIIDIIQDNSVTFLIPLRIDSSERNRNLSLILQQLTEIDNSQIILLEADKESRYEKIDYPNIVHHFIEDHDPIFYRTKYINLLLQMAQTSIVGIWDTDVVIPTKQILESIKIIQQGRAVFCSPFDGRCYVLSMSLSDAYESNKSIDFLTNLQDELPQSFGTYSVGGAYIVNRDMYLSCGGENENFYGWGPEDIERMKRMEILESPVHRVFGPLFHLYHPRNNSFYRNESIGIQNIREFIKVSNMDYEELLEYIRIGKK